jgi:predicted MPP superfamily phosphohydrolase
MKIITIGDLHGSRVWKQINPEDWDHLIFMGDYVDSGDYSAGEITQNLKEILDLKKSNFKKVILLWGNHDLAYFYGGHERHYCSGFRKAMLPDLFSLFTSNRILFRAAFQVNNYLWTHAGVVQRWYDNFISEEILPADENLAATLNRLFNAYYEPLFNTSAIRGGLYEDGGIFWAHSAETFKDPLKGFHQVVGHTKTREGIVVANHFDNDTSVTYVDCLQRNVEFYKLVGGRQLTVIDHLMTTK